jgi:alpha-tubulin suppressor-like RCC1 family protein
MGKKISGSNLICSILLSLASFFVLLLPAAAQTRPTSIAVSPPTASVGPQQTQQFTVVSGTPLALGEARSMAVGSTHTCALLSNGTVECWGNNANGDLGNGTTTTSSTPVQVSGVGGIGFLSGVMAIAAGDGHTCALVSGGSVDCWGYNGNGELGNGTTTSSGTPVQVSAVSGDGLLNGVTAIAAGTFQTCALLSGGTVDCWGYNGDGELGNGTTTNSSTPVQVGGVGGALSGVIAIATGGYHTCALVSSGGADCWGDNEFGELGNGTTTNSSTPVQVSAVGGTGALSEGVAIATGDYHTCVLISGGMVDCWGNNFYGELGNGTTTNSSTPVQVSGVGGAGLLSGVAAIAAGSGYDHVCVQLSGGTVNCWGYNVDGELGNGATTNSDTPVQVIGVGGTGVLGGVTTIAANDYHICALISGGTVDCWGSNSNGELGNGTTTGSSSPVIVVAGNGGTGLPGLGSLSLGVNSTSESHCLLVSNGTADCWGANNNGELGNGTTTSSSTPVPVSGAGGTGVLSGVTAIAPGGPGLSQTCALLSGGTVDCWGDNSVGELGNGGTTSSSTPVPVSGLGGSGVLGGVIAISAGDFFACALISGGTVDCWGDNNNGELGNGTTTNSSVPIQVSGLGGTGVLSGVTAIGAGIYNVCVLLSSGTVDCWGDNTFGALGNGGTTSSSRPVQVSGVGGSGILNGATAIAVGGNDHVCALVSGGTVDCWGNNADGELGNGTLTASATPVAVSGLSGATAVAAGEYHTCALILNGTVDCWGENSLGQLGNGTTTNSSNPVIVSGVGGTGVLGGVTAIAATQFDSCALLASGTVYCWGDNRNGDLGNGTITTDSATPVPTSAVVPSAAWTSSNTGIATINSASGLATAVGSGVTTIGATYGTLATMATLTVTPTPQAPAITSTNSTTFAVGTAGTFMVTATGFPTPTLSETGALPSGVTFNAATGVLSGTPASATGSPFSITITATNGVGNNAVQTFILTVNPSVTVGLSPTSLNFANETLGSGSSAQMIALTNGGTAALSISSIAIVGTNSADFAQTNTCGTSVPAEGACMISIIFKPAGTGLRTASLAVTDNGAGSPQMASLTGTGTVAPPSCSLSVTSNSGALDKIQAGQSLTATLTCAAPANDSLSGTINWGDGSSNSTSTATATGGSATLSFTHAYATASNPTDSLSATLTDTTSTLAGTVSPASVAITVFAATVVMPSQSSVSATPGQPVSDALSFAGGTAEAGVVFSTITCTVTPTAPCTVSPTTLTLDANGNGTVTVTVTPPVSTTSLPVPASEMPKTGLFGLLILLSGLGLVSFGVSLSIGQRRISTGWSLALLLLALPILLAMGACGGGSSTSTSTTPTPVTYTASVHAQSTATSQLPSFQANGVVMIVVQ